MTNKVGRPLKFKTVKELQDKIDGYFVLMGKENRPLTITGLAVHLDTSRETLLDYEDKEKYSDTIKKAKEKIHNWVEEYLFTGKNTAGAIFNLKNNYSWRDKKEIDHTTKGKPIKSILDNAILHNNSNEEDTELEEED